MVNMAISAVVLLAVNMLEKRRDFLTEASKARRGEQMSLYVDIEKRLGAFCLQLKV